MSIDIILIVEIPVFLSVFHFLPLEEVVYN